MMTNRRETAGRVWWLAVTLILLAHCNTILSAPVARAEPSISETGVIRYLEQFGYLPSVNSTSDEIVSKETLAKAISEFQYSSGIDVTDISDTETTGLMTMSRCDVADGPFTSAYKRSRRYVLSFPRGYKHHFKYRVIEYSEKLSRRIVDETIAKAFAVWTEYADLNITQELYKVPDIVIAFKRGKHGGCRPFDGPLTANGGFNKLAHAWPVAPRYSGGIHFDEDERWNEESALGVSLLRIAIHEAGHALGLGHSSDKGSIMYAHNRRDLEPKLNQDDIDGIQHLYGKRPKKKVHDYIADPGSASRTSSTIAIIHQSSLLFSLLCLLHLRSVI